MKPSYTQAFASITNCSIAALKDRKYSYCVKKQRNIPLFHSEIGFTFGWVFIRERRLFIRRLRKRKITRPVCFESRTNSSSSMISSIWHKQSISWTFLIDAMAISAKEMPKNHTDKERFAAASSCIQTGILTLLFSRKRRRSSPSPFISHRVLEAVASRILKSLCTCSWGRIDYGNGYFAKQKI